MAFIININRLYSMEVSNGSEGINLQKGVSVLLSSKEIPLFILAVVKGYHSTIKLQSKSRRTCSGKFLPVSRIFSLWHFFNIDLAVYQ